jgi:ribosomal protein L37AE/L43A
MNMYTRGNCEACGVQANLQVVDRGLWVCDSCYTAGYEDDQTSNAEEANEND